MEKHSEEESKAIQDRARIFVNDERVGTPISGIETFLQKHQKSIAWQLRNQNHGRGLNDNQLNRIGAISQVYEAIVGLNKNYSEELLQRIEDYLESAHTVLNQTDTKNKSFLSKRGIARARKDVVLSRDEYFWNLHLDSTGDLLEGICRVRNGEPEEKAWTTSNYDFRERLKAGELDTGELSELLGERRYLFQRTFVNTRYDHSL